MIAIILAAGVGRRLDGRHNEPKCLLQIGGKSLLERHWDSLRSTGIRRAAICVGYQADKIQAEIDRLGANKFFRIVHNENFERGSVLSLWCARQYLGTSETLLMDADVLYDPRILERLVNTKTANCFLLDRDFEPGEEPVKLCVSNGRLVEFRKQVDEGLGADLRGESVGFFRFAQDMGTRLALQVEEYYANQRHDEPYEEPLRDILLQCPAEFGYEDITGLPWIEIDYPDDVDRAQAVIFPRIVESRNSP